MMKLRRNFVTLLTIVLFVLSFSIQAYADETETTVAEPISIKEITVEIVNDNGTIEFKSGEPEKYTVAFDLNPSNYYIGERVRANVYVRVKEGYFFEKIRKSNVKLTGDDNNASKGDVASNDEKVNVEIKISAVAGELDSPNDVYWDEGNFGYGYWEEVEGATSYKVSINSKTITVRNTYVDLRTYLKSGKYNSFKVRAVSTKSSVKNSEWSESDELYVESYYNSSIYDNCYYPGSSWNGNLNIPNRNGWVQNLDGTWYYLSNGNIHRGWLELSDGTYYLNSDGIMLTGWQKIDKSWYIFDGSGRMLRNTAVTSANGLWHYYLGYDGKMQTNCWQNANGRWYFVGSDEVLINREIDYKDVSGISRTYRVGADGFIVYGWYWDGQYWYYYQPGTGYKMKDTIIDGRYWLDKNGRWYK